MYNEIEIGNDSDTSLNFFTKDLVRIKKVHIFVKQIRKKKYKNTHRGIEQSVARKAHNLEVVGSSPAPATKGVLNGEQRSLKYCSLTVGFD